MTSLVELEGADLGRYTSPPPRKVPPVPVSLPEEVRIGAEATNIAYSLIAMDADGRVIAERPLRLAVRLNIDGVTHLWSEDGAITAGVSIDHSKRTLSFNIRFSPQGKSAIGAYADAKFLQTLSSASSIKLGLLGDLSLELPGPWVESLRIDEASLRFLKLASDVAILAHIDLRVPRDVNDDVIKDLLTARKLLSGEEVRGTWSTATIRLGHDGLETIREALANKKNHDFLHVSAVTLRVGDQEIPLGEVRQHIPEAEVAGLVVEEDEVVLTLVAPGGSASTVISPLYPKGGVVRRLPFIATVHAEHDFAQRSEDILREELGRSA